MIYNPGSALKDFQVTKSDHISNNKAMATCRLCAGWSLIKIAALFKCSCVCFVSHRAGVDVKV